MNKILLSIAGCAQLTGIHLCAAQTIKLDSSTLQPVQVSMLFVKLDGRKVVRITKDPSVVAVDQPTFAKVISVPFSNGTIEAEVLSKLLKDAPEPARGFIGIAFRINGQNSKFECIYIRPTNGRANDQVRRNHSVQYFSYPDYPYQRLRKESPETYETHADMGLNEWTKLRIVVKGNQAVLYINNNKEATLIVNDLKHGADAIGAIGLWADVGTEAFFTDLRIFPEN